MTVFVIETAVLLFVVYLVGCAAGCWLRRSFQK